MPTYEYECKSCGYSFEIFQAMSEDPLKVCPQCGKEVRRLIFGGTGVIFKGSGFYVTDKSAAKSTAASKGAAKNSGSTTETSSTGDSGSAAASKSGTAGSAEKAKPAAKPA